MMDGRLKTGLPALLQASFPDFLRDAWLLERLQQQGVVRDLPAGQVVCQQGDSCAGLPLVLAGRMRVYKVGESGREITLYRIGAGDSCVLTASCIMSSVPFPALAVVERDARVLLVPAGVAREWMQQSERWRSYLFALVARRLADIISVVEEVAFQRLDSRVAGWLLEHARDGVAHTTHHELAVEVGSSREVVSRLLRDLENNGLIRRQRGEIRLLDRTRLQQVAGM